MKPFKQAIKSVSVDVLTDYIKKLSFGMFLCGLVAGISVIFVGVSGKENDFYGVIQFVLITLLFLGLAYFFYYRIYKDLLPEILDRIKEDE